MLKSVELVGTAVKLVPLENIHEQGLYEAAKPKEIWEYLPVKVHRLSDMKQLIESAGSGQQIAVFIGPEGGFDPEEIRLATEAGILPITLGKRILRTETAGFTTIAWLMYQLEN